jgi:hypothetical protein
MKYVPYACVGGGLSALIQAWQIKVPINYKLLLALIGMVLIFLSVVIQWHLLKKK